MAEIKVVDAEEQSGGIARIEIEGIDQSKIVSMLFIKDNNTSQFMGVDGWTANETAIKIGSEKPHQYDDKNKRIIKIGHPIVDKISPYSPVEILIPDLNIKKVLQWPAIEPSYEGISPEIVTTTFQTSLPSKSEEDINDDLEPESKKTSEKVVAKNAGTIQNKTYFVYLLLVLIIGLGSGWLIHEYIYPKDTNNDIFKSKYENSEVKISELETNINDLKNKIQEIKNESEDILNNKNKLKTELDVKNTKNVELEKTIQNFTENELRQLNLLLEASFASPPSSIFSFESDKSPRGDKDEDIINRLKETNREANNGQLFYKYYVQLKRNRDDENNLEEEFYWLKKAAKEGNSLAIYNLSYNMLNETDMEFNNLLNAIQLLRVTLASRPPPENLKKQIYKKVCNKLNSIDLNLNEELLSQWCLE